ncbi:type IV secretion system protein [Cupriavidus necator]
MGYFEGLLNPICIQAKEFATNVSQNVVTAVLPVVAAALAVMIFFYGLAVVRGEVQAPVMTFVGKIFKHGVIVAVVTAYATGSFNIIDLAWRLQDDFTSVISGSSNAFEAIDKSHFQVVAFFAGAMVYLMDSMNAGSFEGYFMLAMIVLFVLFGGGVVALSLFYIVLSKVGLALLLGLGPFFIAGLAYQPTARFFETWLAAVLNFCMLAAVSALMVPWVSEAQLMAIASSKFNYARDLVEFSIVSVIMFLLMLEIPRLVSGLMSGLDISSGINAYASSKLFYGSSWGSSFPRATQMRGNRAISAQSSAIPTAAMGGHSGR